MEKITVEEYVSRLAPALPRTDEEDFVEWIHINGSFPQLNTFSEWDEYLRLFYKELGTLEPQKHDFGVILVDRETDLPYEIRVYYKGAYWETSEGQRFMSYLTPTDIIDYLRTDYVKEAHYIE